MIIHKLFLEPLSWIAGIATAVLTFYLWATSPNIGAQPTSSPEKINPSFDCNKATWKSEHLICTSQELAILDLELSNTYRDAIARSPQNTSALKYSQIQWLRFHREKCPDEKCLADLYRARSDELKRH